MSLEIELPCDIADSEYNIVIKHVTSLSKLQCFADKKITISSPFDSSTKRCHTIYRGRIIADGWHAINEDNGIYTVHIGKWDRKINTHSPLDVVIDPSNHYNK